MIVKDHRLPTYRLSTHRDVEDWRKVRSPQRNGPWAIHCLEHRKRKFVSSYSKAKEFATLPAACPICEAFDQRCVHCPSDPSQWQADPVVGYTASVGHIAGYAVCQHHKYGCIPEGIDYFETVDVAVKRPVIEIFLGDSITDAKAFAIKYQTGDRDFWIQLHRPPECMTEVSASHYHAALGFAVNVTKLLNQSLKSSSGNGPRAVGFETWEELAKRRTEQ